MAEPQSMTIHPDAPGVQTVEFETPSAGSLLEVVADSGHIRMLAIGDAPLLEIAPPLAEMINLGSFAVKPGALRFAAGERVRVKVANLPDPLPLEHREMSAPEYRAAFGSPKPNGNGVRLVFLPAD